MLKHINQKVKEGYCSKGLQSASGGCALQDLNESDYTFNDMKKQILIGPL